MSRVVLRRSGHTFRSSSRRHSCEFRLDSDFTNLQAKTDKEVGPECLSPLPNLRKTSENVTFDLSWRTGKGGIRKLEEV